MVRLGLAVAADVDLCMLACGTECGAANASSDPVRQAVCQEHQSQVRQKMAQFATAVDAYGTGQFKRVTLPHLMFQEPAPEVNLNPRKIF